MAPAENSPSPAGNGVGRAAETLESFTPPYEISCGVPKPDNAGLPLIIGFDAEWVEQPPKPGDDPDAEDAVPPDAYPHNTVLSYQYACRFNGREWSGIVYTQAGAKIRYPDLTEEELA